jgi:uncharacterized cupredoxin-like copper-binding protein
MKEIVVARPEAAAAPLSRAWLLLAAMIVLVMAVAVGACEKNVSGKAGSASSDSTAIPATVPGGSSAGSAPTSMIPSDTTGAPVVDVHLTEYTIAMPPVIAAGNVTLRVSNNGSTSHGLEIEGNGVHQDVRMNAGEVKMLTVELKPGTYQVYCPVDDHKGKGMQMSLTVR